MQPPVEFGGGKLVRLHSGRPPFASPFAVGAGDRGRTLHTTCRKLSSYLNSPSRQVDANASHLRCRLEQAARTNNKRDAVASLLLLVRVTGVELYTRLAADFLLISAHHHGKSMQMLRICGAGSFMPSRTKTKKRQRPLFLFWCG